MLFPLIFNKMNLPLGKGTSKDWRLLDSFDFEVAINLLDNAVLPLALSWFRIAF